jgi:O-antigen ligase
VSDLFYSMNFLSILPAFAILGVIGIFLFFLMRPFECLLFLLFVRPLIGPTRSIEAKLGPVSINLLGGYSIAVIVLGSLYLATSRKRINLPVGIFGSFAAFLFICLLSLTFTMNISGAIGDIFRYVSAFIVLALMFDLVDTEDKFKSVLKTIILSSLLPVCIGFYQFLTRSGIYIDAGTETSRITSLFLLPNPFAQYLVLVIFACLFALKLSNSFKEKAVFICLFMAAVISLYLTWTKTSWIAFGVGAVLFALLDKRRVLYLPLLSLGFLFLLSLSSISGHLAESVAKKEYGMSSWQWRIMTWKTLYRGFLEKPFLGWGLGSSMDVLMLLNRDPHVPHNDYIRMAVELGVVGFTAFYTFLLVLLTKFLKFINCGNDFLRQANRLCLTIMAVWFVQMYGDNTVNDVTTLMYVFTILGATLKLNSLYTGKPRSLPQETGTGIGQPSVLMPATH